VETGNFENWRRVIEGDRWGLYLFDHQFYFTPISLQSVMRKSGFGSTILLDCNHERPTLDPLRVLRSPRHWVRSWSEWTRARSVWPGHGDVNIMIVVGRKEPGLAAPT
jgi:hypothetical protein